jgi:signal transduction histidine kinase
MRVILDSAEEVVARFFSERSDDPSRGTIEIHGERYVLVRAAALSVEFFDLVRGLYGAERHADADELAQTLLFDLANAVGKADARQLLQQMNMESADPFFKIAAGPMHFARAGWASVDIVSFNFELGPTFLSIYDHPYSFESDAWRRVGRVSDFPVCIMSSGYASGWTQEACGQELVAAELLCRGKGDETCRFLLAPPDQIERRIEEYLQANPDIAARAAGFRIPDFFARQREAEALRRRQQVLERELRQTQKIEALGRLAGGIAHDFNNLMSVVLGQAMLAQRRIASDHPVARDLAKIIRAAERAAALTDQLLAFGRSQVPRMEVIALNPLVEETAHLIERVIGEDIELRVVLAEEAGWVHADRAQLEQVLMNLAVNSRDAMPKGGSLVLATRKVDEERVELSVADTGCGMDEELLSHVFEPFFTTKGEHGSGLGLSTVHGIVTAIGGKLAVESTVGRGTRFAVELPCVAEPEAAESPPPLQAPQGSGTVLVVEDRDDLRELIGHALVAFGFRAILADSPEHALELLTQGEPAIDLLLTDIIMPRMSGVELAEKARVVRSSLKILFMSGYAPNREQRAILAENEDIFIRKPFTPDELATRVEALLRE